MNEGTQQYTPLPIDDVWNLLEHQSFGSIQSNDIVREINKGILSKIATNETEFVLYFTATQAKDNSKYAIAARKFFNMDRAYEVQFQPSNMVSETPLLFAEGMVIVRWL